jgi:uncharacterized protein (UPF0332 family)
VSNRLTPSALLAKAERACASARLLCGASDAEGACNRAYYAMFDAARAALLASGAVAGKTHSGLMSAFSEHLVKPAWRRRRWAACSSAPRKSV